MTSLFFYQIPNGMKIARSQLQKLAQFGRRAKAVAQQGADASKKADDKVASLKAEADAKIVGLMAEHTTKVGELMAARQKLEQQELQTERLAQSNRETVQTLGGAQRANALMR